MAAFLACLSLPAAQAQVTSNLDDLPQAKTAVPAKKQPPTARSVKKRPVRNTSATVPPAAPSAAPARAKSLPARNTVPGVPPAPPPPVVLPPPFVPVQIHPPLPPVEVTAVADAKSSTIALPNGGLRVLFPSGSEALNTDSLKALQVYGSELARHPEQRVVLLSHATLPGDDVSMPRRISLARALAVRSIFVHAGVATTRLYPRALGRPENGDSAPADRLDVMIEANPVNTSAPSANGMP
ncbi:OmpA family protein [Gluconobacter kanchanaburiensis]|nr:OmpA family protein [Gluconobacter kanchanaburiensis]